MQSALNEFSGNEEREQRGPGWGEAQELEDACQRLPPSYLRDTIKKNQISPSKAFYLLLHHYIYSSTFYFYFCLSQNEPIEVRQRVK